MRGRDQQFSRREVLASAVAATLGIVGAMKARPGVAQSPQTGPDSVSLEKPPVLLVGDTWTYSVNDRMSPADDHTETLKVLGRFRDGYVIEFTNSRGQKRNAPINFALNTLARFFQDGPVIELRNFKWPMKPGENWSFEYESRGQFDGFEDVSLNERRASVQAIEEVVVPAGRFTAARVSITGSYRMKRNPGHGSGMVEERHWYSPVTRSYVKGEINHRNNLGMPTFLIRRELTSFTLAPGGRNIV